MEHLDAAFVQHRRMCRHIQLLEDALAKRGCYEDVFKILIAAEDDRTEWDKRFPSS